MWKKKDYVTSGLHKIREKIPAATNQVLNRSDDTDEDAKSKKSPMDESLRKALEKRRDEFLKNRRDITSRLTEALAVIPDDTSLYSSILEEIEKSRKTFTELMEKLQAIDETKWDNENFSAELADATKTTENSRLEYLRLSAKLERIKDNRKGEMDTKPDSFILELTSLSFKQLFRFGLIFYLPLMVSIFIAAFFIIAAIVFSMRF